MGLQISKKFLNFLFIFNQEKVFLNNLNYASDSNIEEVMSDRSLERTFKKPQYFLLGYMAVVIKTNKSVI